MAALVCIFTRLLPRHSGRALGLSAMLMSIFPNTPLAGRVKTLILATFDVLEEEAQEHAARMAALAEGWGSLEKAEALDWSYRVKKDLGHKLRWRSESEREAFRRYEQEQYKAYEILIRRPPRA